MMKSVWIYQRTVMETKRDTAVHWMEIDMSRCTTYNRVHLLDLVDILIGPNMVDFLVTMSVAQKLV